MFSLIFFLTVLDNKPAPSLSRRSRALLSVQSELNHMFSGIVAVWKSADRCQSVYCWKIQDWREHGCKLHASCLFTVSRLWSTGGSLSLVIRSLICWFMLNQCPSNVSRDSRQALNDHSSALHLKRNGQSRSSEKLIHCCLLFSPDDSELMNPGAGNSNVFFPSGSPCWKTTFNWCHKLLESTAEKQTGSQRPAK